MHDFHFLDGELYCERVKVSDIVSLSGTPLFVYSRKTVSDHYRKLDTAFSSISHLICYSLKANSSIAICRILAEMGSGADITSGGELYKARMAGVPSERIVYAGVGKTRGEIEYALDSGILMFNVESVQELHLINETAGRMGERAAAAIRLNPDVEVDTHDYTKTGTSENKFGLAFEDAEKLFLEKSAFPNVDITGIHVHIGSQITSVEPYVESVRKVIGFAEGLRGRGVELKSLNIGGGLGIIYRDEKPSTAEEFAQAIVPLVEPTGLRVIIEPGRFIVGNAGIMVTKVLYTKKSPSRSFVVVDAGMNDLIRPMLYDAYHDIKPVHAAPPGAEDGVVDVVGPICESGDFLAKDRALPRVKSGDLLAVFSVGAYGFSMASNYNSRLRAAEILVDGERFTMVREKETYDDLVRGETGRFTKMCAGGNDFIVIDNRFGNYPDGTVLAARLCRRSHSIGADGLLFLEKGQDAGRLKMRIFNPDGSEAEMCGNGARCIAAFAYCKGIGSRKLNFETLAGLVSAEIIDGEVKLKMSEPAGLKLSLELSVDGRTYPASFINTGVPHTVLVVEDIETADVESLGGKIRNLPVFKPAGTNVDWVEVIDTNRIRLRTYERGVEGETLACGTGAAASAIVCSLLGKTASPVSVETRGGSILTVCFERGEKVTDVYLQGDARFVCEGSFDLSPSS